MRSQLVSLSKRATTCIAKPSKALSQKPYYTIAMSTRIRASAASTFPESYLGNMMSSKGSALNLVAPEFRSSSASFPREIIFLGGAPGSGKGTNSSHIAKCRKFTAPTITVSDLLNTPTCRALKDRGVMVDDHVVFNALVEELQKPVYNNGVVVDGFPRTVKQAEFVQKISNKGISLSAPSKIMFVMLNVDETESISRQQERGRRAMQMSREVRQTDIDVSASKQRYRVFREQYDAVMSLAKQFPCHVVDATGEVDSVRREISNKLSLSF